MGARQPRGIQARRVPAVQFDGGPGGVLRRQFHKPAVGVGDVGLRRQVLAGQVQEPHAQRVRELFAVARRQPAPHQPKPQGGGQAPVEPQRPLRRRPVHGLRLRVGVRVSQHLQHGAARQMRQQHFVHHRGGVGVFPGGERLEQQVQERLVRDAAGGHVAKHDCGGKPRGGVRVFVVGGVVLQTGPGVGHRHVPHVGVGVGAGRRPLHRHENGVAAFLGAPPAGEPNRAAGRLVAQVALQFTQRRHQHVRGGRLGGEQFAGDGFRLRQHGHHVSLGGVALFRRPQGQAGVGGGEDVVGLGKQQNRGMTERGEGKEREEKERRTARANVDTVAPTAPS